MRPESRLFAALAAMLVLAGCATTRQSVDLPPLDSWETRTAVLGALDEWAFKGRIAVKAGDEGFNGSFNWAQAGDAFEASVGGPLGMGTVRMEGDGQAIALTDKDGVRTELADAEAELYRRYGWTIPVASLRYWALGIPDPDRPAETELNAAGQLASLAQGGWDVTITHYREGAGAELPFRLSAVNGDTRVRIVIDDWYFYD